jgi:pimeloyl-ACP methyl ester carboxylesterase
MSDRESTRLERRIRASEEQLFASVGGGVEEFSVQLQRTGLRVRVLAHGRGPAVLLLHGASEGAAVWAPLFPHLGGFRAIAVDLPGHGLSDPLGFRRGRVREQAHEVMADVLDALELDDVPVIGHSLGGMFALWHVAAGSPRVSQVIAIGEPAVALPGVRVRGPLSLLTVRGLGVVVLRSPSPPAVHRRLLTRGLGREDVAGAPPALLDVLRLSVRRPQNARSVASLMHAIDRFRQPRPESVLSDAELAAVATPTTFIIGHGDPYLSPDDARTSIDRIPGARLHAVPGGHAPWLVDVELAARLIRNALPLPTEVRPQRPAGGGQP